RRRPRRHRRRQPSRAGAVRPARARHAVDERGRGPAVSLASRALLLIIAAEALVGGLPAPRRLPPPVPPPAGWALLDPATAGQIQSAAAACESADDWRNLAELYMAAGCFAESESCHRIACELAPGNALFARQWGFALERLSLLDEANEQY